MSRLRGLVLAIACGAAGITHLAHAYEISTHRGLTTAAVDRSVLVTRPDVLETIGLKGVRDETQRFQNSRGVQGRILDLFADGADFEDYVAIFSTSPEIRVTKHFYNPRTGQGLNVPFSPLPIQPSSPDWALAPVADNSNQQFSYWNARQYFFDALTRPTEIERSRAFGLTFQTLGQVAHHLQDMAQPQHVRNDSHCDTAWCALLNIPTTPSLYEKWTDLEQVRGNLPVDPGVGGQAQGYDRESVAGAPFVSTINSPRRFWHTEPWGAISVDTGRGIAEFTHRNFVSARTNFFRTDAGGFIAHPDFPLPAPGPVTEKREISDSDLLGSNQPLRGEIWFIGTVVTDTLTGQTSFNPRASSYSVFAADLRGRSGLRTVTLNQFNFRSAYEYLIPRAVAYSAGMINYFFRGKMDVENDETDPAKIRIVNLGPETMNGRFRLFYDAKDGNRYPVAVDPTDPNRDYSDPNAWFLTIAGLDQAGEYSTRSDALAFIPPANDGSPASPKTVNQYMLVFSGNMGEERVGPGMIGAVAAKRVVQKFARVFAGAEHSMVVKRNGTLLVFGENRNGQLGQGYFSEWPDIGIPTAVAVPGVDKVVEAAGGWYSLVRREDGSLLVWGNNDRGELGIGPTPRYVASPLPLTLPGSGKPSAVAGGWIATYVLKDDGSLWSWGYNGQGQLGDGTYSSRSTPMQVTSNVAALARSSVGDHMLVLRRDGSVWAWGENEAGQLGDGSLVTTSPWGKALPVRVALPGGVVALAAGGDHSLALLSNGTVWAWGYNQGGNLGVGHTGTYQLTPAPVLGLSDVVAIAAGYDFSLALRRDGTVWAWGRNDVCQLGNGRGGLAFEGPYPPTQVQGPSGVTDIAAGEYHALALQADGKLWSWGYNDRGQTGDGTMTASDPWCRPDPRIVLDAN